MRKPAWLCWIALVAVAAAALGEEGAPGGAEGLLSRADLRGMHGERAGSDLSVGEPTVAVAVSQIRVGELPAPGRVPVLYIAFDGAHSLQAQIQRAVEGIERCGRREEIVLTVGRCLGGTGKGGEAAVRRRAELVARALRRRGFRTEVTWGGVKTFCAALPAKRRERIRPVEVTVERMR